MPPSANWRRSSDLPPRRFATTMLSTIFNPTLVAWRLPLHYQPEQISGTPQRLRRLDSSAGNHRPYKRDWRMDDHCTCGISCWPPAPPCAKRSRRQHLLAELDQTWRPRRHWRIRSPANLVGIHFSVVGRNRRRLATPSTALRRFIPRAPDRQAGTRSSLLLIFAQQPQRRIHYVWLPEVGGLARCGRAWVRPGASAVPAHKGTAPQIFLSFWADLQPDAAWAQAGVDFEY